MTNALRTWRSFRALFAMEYSIALLQRTQSIIWTISNTPPLIIMMVWISLADRYGTIGSFGKEEFARYFLFLYLARGFMACWVARSMHEAIRWGKLQPRLMRPIDPFWPLVAEHWAEMAVRVPVTLAFFGIGVWLTGIDIPWAILPFYFLAAFIGWWINFSLYFLAGLAAFWLESVVYLEVVLFRVGMTLGGAIIPLTFFPESLQNILHHLPFAYINYFSAAIATGQLSVNAIFEGFLIALVWLGILTLAHRWLWRQGLKHFTAVGN